MRDLRKQPLVQDEGAWEPMMLVAALIIAAAVGYSLFAERLLPAEQAQARSNSVATEVLGPEAAGRPDRSRG